MNKKKIIIISIVILLIVLLSYVLFLIFKDDDASKLVKGKGEFDSKVSSVLTVDVNPSIEIDLNKDNYVIRVIALNDDAKKIIEGKKLKKKSIDVALNILVKSLKENDYLSEEKNIILVNIDQDDEEFTKFVDEVFNKSIKAENVSADLIVQHAVVTDELYEKAKANGITVSKAYYLSEQIKNIEGLNIDDLKDVSLDEIDNKIEAFKKENSKKNDDSTAENSNKDVNGLNDSSNTSSSSSSNNSQKTGSISKCNNVPQNISIEKASQIAVSNRGGKYGPGYCDVRSTDAYGALSPDGTCSIKVTYNYKNQKCTYYINVITGDIVGNPSCISSSTTINDSQCIIMDDMGVNAREQISIKDEKDTGNEIVSTVEDNSGNLYEYHVSKTNGSIYSKTLIQKAEPVVAASEEE